MTSFIFLVIFLKIMRLVKNTIIFAYFQIFPPIFCIEFCKCQTEAKMIKRIFTCNWIKHAKCQFIINLKTHFLYRLHSLLLKGFLSHMKYLAHLMHSHNVLPLNHPFNLPPLMVMYTPCSN